MSADQGDAVYEYKNAASNVAATSSEMDVAPSAYADLVASQLGAPATATVGDAVPLAWHVTNQSPMWAGTPLPHGLTGSC